MRIGASPASPEVTSAGSLSRSRRRNRGARAVHIRAATTPGATASLLLDLETVLTVAIAWFVFAEHRNAARRHRHGADRCGGAYCSPAPQSAGGGSGAPLIALACLAWAIDNNSTRHVAGNDAMLIAAAKGLAGGTVNIGLALLLAGPRARAWRLATVGFFGYGVSLHAVRRRAARARHRARERLLRRRAVRRRRRRNPPAGRARRRHVLGRRPS